MVSTPFPRKSSAETRSGFGESSSWFRIPHEGHSNSSGSSISQRSRDYSRSSLRVAVPARRGTGAESGEDASRQDGHGLDNLQLHHGDVREFDFDACEAFDVVLCMGLLYHLDAPHVFRLLERMRHR